MAKDSRARLKGRRSLSGRFAALPDVLLRHPAVTSLSHAHSRVLVIMAAGFNGKNNGAITLTKPRAAEYGIKSSATLDAAINELLRRGLIVKTDPGSYQPPTPARYGITWQDMDDTAYSTSRPPYSSYKDWVPEPKVKTDHAVRSLDPDGSTQWTRKVSNL